MVRDFCSDYLSRFLKLVSWADGTEPVPPMTQPLAIDNFFSVRGLPLRAADLSTAAQRRERQARRLT